MHLLRSTLATVASIAALGVAGCSSSESTAPPTPTDTISAAPTSESNAGPEVANPKNLAAVKDPCKLLKPEQAQQLGVGPPKPGGDSGQGEPTCEWQKDDQRIRLAPHTQQGQGLESVMRFEAKTKPDGEIDGYPMIETQPGSITCGIYVGLSEKQTINVRSGISYDSGQDPCDLAKKAAGMVLSNLPPAS